MVDDKHWTAFGACRNASPDDLFVEGAAQRAAREVCAACAVRLECLIDALDNRMVFGVWGGMTERERRALMRRYPDVVSWREQLEAEPGLVVWTHPYRGATSVRTAEPADPAARRLRGVLAGRTDPERDSVHERQGEHEHAGGR